MQRAIESMAAFVVALITLPILVDSAVKGLAVLAVVGLVVLQMRNASAASRHLAWTVGMAGLLILPILSAVLPQWRILPSWMDVVVEKGFPPASEIASGALEPARQMAAALPAPSASLGQSARFSGESGQPIVGSALTESYSIRSEGISLSNWAIVIWLFGAGLMLLRLLICQAGLVVLGFKSRNQRPGPIGIPLNRPPGTFSPTGGEGRDEGVGLMKSSVLQEELMSLSQQVQISRRVTLLLSDRRAIPMTWGILRPHILLPAESIEWPAERRKAVLLHELAHIRRRDCLTQLLVQLACALYWFNPLVWVAAWRIEVEREHACDDFVLSCGIGAPDYAEHVLTIGSTLKESFTANTASVAMARPRGLESRLKTILDATLNRAIPRRPILILCLLGFFSALLPMAMMRAAENATSPQASSRPNPRNAANEGNLANRANPDLQVEVPGGPMRRSSAAIRLEMAEADLARVAKLYENKLVGETEYNNAQRLVEIRRAELRNNAAEVGRLKLQQADTDLARVEQLYAQKLAGEQALAQAREAVELHKAELKGDAIELLRVRLQHAEAQWQRLSELRKKNFVSESESEKARWNVELLRAELDEAKAGPERRTASSETNSAEAASTRSFVRLVVGESKLTFEGKLTTWEQLPEALEKIPNRASTVLELAIESDRLTIAQLNDAQARAGILSRKAGFEYLSYIGVQGLGSKGSPNSSRRTGNLGTSRRDIASAETDTKTSSDVSVQELLQETRNSDHAYKLALSHAADKTGVAAREVVLQWLALAKGGKADESWQWIFPKSKSVLGPEEIHRLQNGAQIEPKRSLGSGEAAMVVTSRFKDNSDRERVAYFYLRRQDGRWLIYESELASPDDAQRRVEGFAAHPGVKFDARREDFVGTWIGGGFLIPISHTFEADGSYTSRFKNEQGAETVHKGTWEFDQRTSSLLRRSDGNLQIMGSVIQLGEDFFQLGSGEGRRTGFHRQKEPSEKPNGLGKAPGPVYENAEQIRF
jgi:hypothetical protein